MVSLDQSLLTLEETRDVNNVLGFLVVDFASESLGGSWTYVIDKQIDVIRCGYICLCDD
jgi:hypothetical protein